MGAGPKALLAKVGSSGRRGRSALRALLAARIAAPIMPMPDQTGNEGRQPRQLAACKDTSKANSERACSRLSTVPFANGPKRSMGHVLGAEKLIFLIRDIDDAAIMTAAPVKSCQIVVQRPPWGRLGSVLYTCKRLPHARALPSTHTYQYRSPAVRGQEP